MQRWEITSEEEDIELRYTVRWSPWGFLDKWIINRKVPSESGFYQLWIKSGAGLDILTTQVAYYGGLRNALRVIVDGMAPAGESLRKMIGSRECWFRFTVNLSQNHLRLLDLWFNARSKSSVFTEDGKKEIMVFQVDTMKKFALPPKESIDLGRKQRDDSEFGPILSSRN